ncbi:MAG: hypothetical protein WEF86_02640 [Gemmatimonadota bacterium]
MRRALLLLVLAAACGSATDDPDASGAADSPADTLAPDTAAHPAGVWADDGAGAIDYMRSRAFDFTGDAAAERVLVSAHGPSYDSLQIGLAITDTAGDTLWADGWSSLHYFRYEPLAGKPDTTVARIVRNHVDALVADDRFSDAGLPAALQRGGSSEDVREAVRYHLAELDWREESGLTPADVTPPQAHSSLDASLIAPMRVDAVMNELLARPAFMYYAGGEATYAIGWSGRESAFVRLYSCC